MTKIKYFFACECGQIFDIDEDTFIRLQPNQKFVCKDCLKQEDQIVALDLPNGNKIIENSDF